ncbi:MAG: hypothetical protein ACK5WV_02720 [Chryseotalea sp.]
MEFLNYLVKGLSVVTIIFLLGYTFLSTTKFYRNRNRNEVQYLSLFFGSIILVTIYSCFITQFKTINILFFFGVIAFIFLVNRSSKNIEFKQNIRVNFLREAILSILFNAIVFLFFYALNFSRVVNFTEFIHFDSPFQDVNFYADCADALNTYGQENYLQIQNSFAQFHGTEPYHYFDLWIVAFAAKIFDKNSIYPQSLFILPFFQTILCVGYFSIFEKGSFKNFIQAALLTFACGYAPEIVKVIPHFKGILPFSFFASAATHIAIYFLFFLGAYLFKEDKKISILILSMLCIATPIAIPGILGGILLFLFTNYVTRKSTENGKDFVESISIPIITGLLFLIFYSITSIQFQGPQSEIQSQSVFAKDVNSSIKTFIGFHVVTAIPLVPLFLFIVYTLYQDKVLYQDVLLSKIFPFMLLCGAAAYAVYFQDYNGFQLMKQPVNASICCVAVICYIRSYNALHVFSLKRILPIFLFMILCAYHFVHYVAKSPDKFPINNQYLIKVKCELDKEKTDFNVGILCNPQKPQFKLTLHRHGYLKYADLCNGIAYLNNAKDVALDPADLETYLKRSSYAQQTLLLNAKDEEAFRIKFMKKNKIKFLLVEGSDFLPDSNFQLIAKDDINKFRLFKLL